jgi:hypothetical protein
MLIGGAEFSPQENSVLPGKYSVVPGEYSAVIVQQGFWKTSG